MTLREKLARFTLLAAPSLAWGIGYLLNCVVVAANKGVMPYLAHPCKPDDTDVIHACMTHASHLKFLADWLWTAGSWYSPGDWFLAFAQDTIGPFFITWVILHVWDDLIG